MKPTLINYKQIEKLKNQHPELVVHDEIRLATDELFDIEHPELKDSKTEEDLHNYFEQLTNGKPQEWGEWFYYPWLNQLVHFPPKEALRALRTSRNRNLVTQEEQAKLYDSTVVIIGMSVGSNVVEALVSQGVGSKLVLVDMDIIEPSNLNRIRAPYHHVGIHKVEAIARKVYEIDPYIEIVGYHEGLNEQNLKEILDNHKPHIVIDEMDDLRMKIILREQVRQRGLPVIMAADDGDGALIDIERYDLNPEQAIFDGRIPSEILERIKNDNIARAELGMMIGKYFVGADNIPLRMYQSLREVGKTLPSWPQLGGAAALSGIGLAYVSKKIMLGQDIKQGRQLISLDALLDLEAEKPENQIELKKYKDLMKGDA